GQIPQRRSSAPSKLSACPSHPLPAVANSQRASRSRASSRTLNLHDTLNAFHSSLTFPGPGSLTFFDGERRTTQHQDTLLHRVAPVNLFNRTRGQYSTTTTLD